MWLLIAGKGIEWISCVLLTIIYIVIRIKINHRISRVDEEAPLLRSAKNPSVNGHKTKMGFKLTFVPIVFILLRAPGTLKSLLAMTPTAPSHGTFFDILTVMQSLGDTGQGFTNAIFFGILTEKVRKNWHALCQQTCCPCLEPVNEPPKVYTGGAYTDSLKVSFVNFEKPSRTFTPLKQS